MKKLITKNQVEVIEKLCNELIKIETENLQECEKNKNYFGAFMSVHVIKSWITVKSSANLYYRKRFKI
jgi:hypothetical protein